MSWIDSHRNHILHSSVYACTLACAIQQILPKTSVLSPPTSSLSSSSWFWWWLQFPPLVLAGGLSLWGLYAEIKFAFLRIGLPPGDSGIPIFGHMLEAFSVGPGRWKVERFRRYQSSHVSFNMLMIPCVVVKDEDDVRWWLVQERRGHIVPSFLSHVQSLIGPEAIILQSATGHRRLRKIFEPSFSPTAVRGYAEMVDTTVQAELEKWSRRGTSKNGTTYITDSLTTSEDGSRDDCDDSFCSPKEWAMLAMRLFFVCAFGKVDETLLGILSDKFHTWAEGFISRIPLNLPGTPLRRGHKAKKEMIEILHHMVDEFREENPPGSPGAENSMMGRLCYGADDDGNKLTDEQLITNIMFILFAGHDTTKGSFCAFAHFLAEYPDIRVMLEEEVKTFSEPLDVDQLKAAPILNAFLAETWRFVPPLSSHNSTLTRDMEFKGYKFRKGTRLSLDIQAFHVMDEERYPDVLEFRLDRWIPEGHPMHNPKYFQKDVDYNIPSTKYRAFGMGAHMCLGAHFAKLEARIVLTRLLQNYNLEIRNDTLNLIPLLQYSNEFKLTKKI